MAGDMPSLSLLSLEDELTCSICLCSFENPVTLPCGHNFCQGCLDETWKESFLLSCPQCRHQYPSKPELKKNTVLSAVVDTFKMKSVSLESDLTNDVPVKKEPEVIKCDTCMEATAFKTCLTCMASFCENHVKPHQENPIFRSHQLSDPLGDLQERICQDHCKIMEFFCQQHECSICSTCLQQSHRGCDYTTPQERRAQKESEMRGMLNLLDRKIDKNNIVMAQMRQQQLQLQDDAAVRKKMVSTEYQFIRDLVARDEQDALKAVDKDLESGQTKLQSLIKKFGQNVEKMTAAKVELNSLLSSADSLSFLKGSVELPFNAKFEPYCPRMNMDSKTVIAHHSSAVALKELLNKVLTLPAEDRITLLNSDLKENLLDEASSSDSEDLAMASSEVPSEKASSDEVPVITTPVPEPHGVHQGPNYLPTYISPSNLWFRPAGLHFQSAPCRGAAAFRPCGQKMKPAHPNKCPGHTKGQKEKGKDKCPGHTKGQKEKEKKSQQHCGKGEDHGKRPTKPTQSGKPSAKPAGSSKPPTCRKK